jgi:ribonucleotide reductase alpha subunit
MHDYSPIGIGVQGLADAFIKMRYPFETPQAMQLNRDIFETMYFGAVEVCWCGWCGYVFS